MKKHITGLAIVAAASFLAGCQTPKNNLLEHYYAFPGATGLKKVPAQQVQLAVLPVSKTDGKQAEKLIKSYGARHYASLGMAAVQGPELTDQEIRQFAGSVGGDVVIYVRGFMGMRPASRMVVGSYTPPSVSYGRASSYGSSSGSANTYGSTPWGPMNFNTYGSGSSYGTASATVVNPGSTTYLRENYMEPVFAHQIAVMQSPQGQLNNWEIVRRNLNRQMPEGWRYEDETTMRQAAANLASMAGVPLPKRLQPTGSSMDLSFIARVNKAKSQEEANKIYDALPKVQQYVYDRSFGHKNITVAQVQAWADEFNKKRRAGSEGS